MAISKIVQDSINGGVAGTGPAFSAYLSANQTGISQSTWTKIQLNTEEFDTASAFDNTTNYRFTPLVAGYYQVNLTVWMSSSTTLGTLGAGAIYKNGTRYKQSIVNLAGGSGGATSVNEIGTQVSSIINMNGSTDYLEFYGYEVGFTANGIIESGISSTSASAVLIRSA